MKILVYQIGQLGDTIVSIPALRAVRHHFGHTSRLSLLHDVTYRLVTSAMVLEDTGLVDEFIPYTPEKTTGRKLRTMARLWNRLRCERFDAVVSVLPSDRPCWSLARDRMFFRACGISRLIGFQPYAESEIRPRSLSGRPQRTASEAILRLRRLFAENVGLARGNLFALPLLTPGADPRKSIDCWLASRRNYPDRRLIAVCPGCKKAGNTWPIERFLEIADRLSRLRQFEIVIVGGPAERGLADFLRDALGGQAIHAAGCFSVTESAALLSRCSLLIGLDTGTTHLAAAVGVPCVVIQSANSFPGQWDPLGGSHSVIRADVPCAGCLRQECPVAGHPCMESLTVDAVWEAIESRVETSARPSPQTASIGRGSETLRVDTEPRSQGAGYGYATGSVPSLNALQDAEATSVRPLAVAEFATSPQTASIGRGSETLRADTEPRPQGAVYGRATGSGHFPDALQDAEATSVRPIAVAATSPQTACFGRGSETLRAGTEQRPQGAVHGRATACATSVVSQTVYQP